jgi:hypothetical protein
MKLSSGRVLPALAAFLFVTLLSIHAHAASVVPLDIDQITAAAQHVVHVRCTGNAVEPDSLAGVATVTTFEVLDRAKGPNNRRLVVRQPGGELNGIAVNYHVPTFTVGEEYVLFMPAPSKAGLASPVGLAQGVFTVARGQAGTVVGNGRDFAEMLPSADPASVPEGIRARLQLAAPERKQMALADFMVMLRNKAGTR